MTDEIHRDSFSAWQSLCEIGGLEPNGRDEGLALQLQNVLNPNAKNLETAITNSTIDSFLNAFFQAIQPFSNMFQDILNFFEKAGGHDGQNQWRLSIGEIEVNFSHFEKYLKLWNEIEYEYDIPSLDQASAFLFNSIRNDFGGPTYLRENDINTTPIKTGFSDVDDWLAKYNKGIYAPYPLSLYPDNFSNGLDDAARIVMVALSVIHQQGLNREDMINEHRARSYKTEKKDAFHPWTIAQNETDHWLCSSIQYLACLLSRPKQECKNFGEAFATALKKNPRRKFNAKVQTENIEKLLSLPVWKNRYDFYGVWVATEIIKALEGHRINIHHQNGELKFAFKETKIADIHTTIPKFSLISERKTKLENPVGKSRRHNVQPDFGLWAGENSKNDCKLIVEVKHYKKRSKRNFKDALIDYAHAHPKANVVLVNYGPVGKGFSDFPKEIEDRCQMIGFMNPQSIEAQNTFYTIVRQTVGEPVHQQLKKETKVIALDVSASMKGILKSTWFSNFLGDFEHDISQLFLIDTTIIAVENRNMVHDWLSKNTLGTSTSLLAPITDLLKQHRQVFVITDNSGMKSLNDLSTMTRTLDVENTEVKLLMISMNNL